MKERMVLDLKGNKARQEIVKIQEYTRNDNFDCIVFKKVNQVPETFEELKELCKNLKGIEFAGGNAKGKIIQLDNIWFAENGDIWGYSENWEEVCVIGKNRTPAQMWQIIKSLIGEE